MTMKSSKNFICLILAIAMFLSGMCSNSIKADSFLECVNHCEGSSTLSTFNDITESPNFIIEELSGSRIVANATRFDRRSEEKTHSNANFNLSFANTLLKNLASYSMGIDCELSQVIHSTIVIINFIHQKDGKK